MGDLMAAGISVEVVPGITAGIAAPAYAGIPVTHRGYSSSVTFVTGHESAGKYRPQVNWRAIAQASENHRDLHGGTQLAQYHAVADAGRATRSDTDSADSLGHSARAGRADRYAERYCG